tara:strand:- start:176 stop:397 length:222 start_codon:yes stop_codon:yes gene_type:complete
MKTSKNPTTFPEYKMGKPIKVSLPRQVLDPMMPSQPSFFLFFLKIEGLFVLIIAERSSLSFSINSEKSEIVCS